ncbi:MAG: hypothetical protein Q9216_000953 [Gyalolechia sp. 2 TL-2023]
MPVQPPIGKDDTKPKDEAHGALRKEQDRATSRSISYPGPPTSFFLATEEMLNKSHIDSNNHGVDSTFGVRSIAETTDDGRLGQEGADDTSHNLDEDHGRRRSTLRAWPQSRDRSSEEAMLAKDNGNESPPIGFPRLSSTLPSVSSLSQESQGANHSLPSSPKSTSSRSGRPADEDSMDDGGSQAIGSSEEEADIDQSAQVANDAPQLIMPSIQMPSRRPFTERGKSMGKVKILIAGDAGLGKTSLIKSIVQLCEDIVHVDPVTLPAPLTAQLSKGSDQTRSLKASYSSTSQIHEIWASTKAHPGWWTELEENKTLRRRKSIDDPVLERNICFVDTPGYGRGLSITEGIQAVVSYIEKQLPRSFSAGANGRSELVSMLSGNGGTQVDVVLYLIGKEIKPADLSLLQRMSQITNVIPLLCKADTIDPAHLGSVKQSISDELAQIGIKPFSFPLNKSLTSPYAVCSAPSNDEDNMDASLLMSSEYIQPLLPSELAMVIDQLLDTDSIARLKHLSAKKLVQSSTTLPHMNATSASSGLRIDMASSSSFSTISQTLPSNTLRLPLQSPVQLAEYTRREEKLAQIRLAKWASDLRKTMQDERRQFEALSHVERTSWLTEKLDECNRDVTFPDGKTTSRTELAGTTSPLGLTSMNDPLGLLRCDAYLRQHGLRIFQVVGTFGVFGAVAVWIARNLSSCSEWSWTWGESRTWTC